MAPTGAASVAAHIPYLRRYARALCGSQISGDHYVRSVLETIIADPACISANAPRVDLFRVFHGIWDTAQPAEFDEGAETDREQSAQAHLRAIVGPARQAILLTVMEGFSAAEAARILNATESDVEELIGRAHADLDQLERTDVLIIEDEPIIALDLEQIVASLGHRVTGNAATHEEAVSLAERDPPGLVLADIQLADGSSGIEAVSEILGQIEAPVIFITAYPERLLTGDRPEPAFLITKPFMTDAVKLAIAQALFFHRPALAQEASSGEASTAAQPTA